MPDDYSTHLSRIRQRAFAVHEGTLTHVRGTVFARMPHREGLMHATYKLLQVTDFPAIRRKRLETLQVNVGYRCNQTCTHCHVNAGPHRTEAMERETVDAVIAFLARSGVKQLDITGGAPELNPHFRALVREARALGVAVTDRCNLTILHEPGQADLAEFLAANGVGIIASLPCYQEDNVDRQRGKGVFRASIDALQRLNALGYAQPGSGLTLDLVYNPQGAALPPPQAELEAAYHTQLRTQFGIDFNRLYVLANMPIQRFGSTLVSQGQFEPYMRLLRASHRDDNLEHVMCRTLLSVDWRGNLYDCDFNQMLGIALRRRDGRPARLADLADGELDGWPIAVADHCYGCTAGQGSSCGGALSVAETANVGAAS